MLDLASCVDLTSARSAGSRGGYLGNTPPAVVTSSSEIRRVLVADAQIPFVTGGAELMVIRLVEQLRRRYDVEVVRLPFRPEVKSTLITQAAAWRLLDLTSANGRPVDLLIATRFPSYFARHPRKVAWVTHQHRAAYDLCGTPYSDFDHCEEDVGIRRQLIELDQTMLGECRRVFTIAQNTAARLKKFNGVDAVALYHPPPLVGSLHEGASTDYVLVVSRLEPVKRPDLAIRAMAHAPGTIRLVIVGDGSERQQLEQLAADLGVTDRVTFEGAPDDTRVAALYADALAVIYTPFDEDYGYVTLEAFLAHKPVITAADSGGTLEFVADRQTGLVTPPDPEALGRAITYLSADRTLARTLGDAGYERARAITWDGVVEQLVG
jgi:glycosyltransferase involved in cell wall biosynthesis